MDFEITSADANRKFSEILRSVREQNASYVVTSHGKPVARILPAKNNDVVRVTARANLLKRLKSQRSKVIERWTRDELYERDT